jgi:hypothetical protein
MHKWTWQLSELPRKPTWSVRAELGWIAHFWAVRSQRAIEQLFAQTDPVSSRTSAPTIAFELDARTK